MTGFAHGVSVMDQIETILMDQRTIGFSKFLRNWRCAQNLKLEAVASMLGVSVSTWNHWETGRRVPSLTNLFAIADFLEIPAQCLICAKNEICSIPHDLRPGAAKALCVSSTD